MSSYVYPAFPGLSVEVKRKPIYATKLQESDSGMETRFAKQATPRYRYELTYSVLSTNRGGTNEVMSLLAFFDTHKGRWDSFLFADPFNGSQVRVRFDQDELELTQIVPGLWECSVSLISVK